MPLSIITWGFFVTGAARSLGVPVSQYIDDRHVGPLFSLFYFIFFARASLVPSKVLA